jgi:guanine deaminase
MTFIYTNILSPISPEEIEYHPNAILQIENGVIAQILPYSPEILAEDRTDCVCTPGLIDAHVHLSQYRARGMYKPDLMEWLHSYIFTEEARAANPEYASLLANEFFDALLKAGTTSAVVYVTPSKNATDIAFEVAREKGIRAWIGKTMMDTDAPVGLVEDTDASLRDSEDLCRRWHRSTSLLEYVFTPRFVPVCTPALMSGTSRLAREYDTLIQTHLSENRGEIALVESMYGMSYTAVYEHFGLLGPKTLLGHCIHLKEDEIALLRDSGSKIVHCPDSNFYLASGVFPWNRLHGIDIALGSDVGAGTTLSLPHTMKMALYRQDSERPSPSRAFYWCTLGCANALGRPDLGAIRPGMAADLTFWNLPLSGSAEEAVSRIVFTSPDVRAVYVAGQRRYES